MNQQDFETAQAYMLACMEPVQDGVHDANHVYRVLYAALRIAKAEAKTHAVDTDVLVLAALLHDIARKEEQQDPALRHAEAGAHKACAFLRETGWGEATANHVRDCIASHSYSKKSPPASVEAKILYDADKLDLTGAVGVSRALLFGYSIGEPLYLLGQDGLPTPGKKQEPPSLLREYHRKLKKLHTRFYTAEGTRLAQKRQRDMDAWFAALQKEVRGTYKRGKADLEALLQQGEMR